MRRAITWAWKQRGLSGAALKRNATFPLKLAKGLWESWRLVGAFDAQRPRHGGRHPLHQAGQRREHRIPPEQNPGGGTVITSGCTDWTRAATPPSR